MDNPDQINEIFDAISYAKGASVIRMLAGHLGVTEFMKGEKKHKLYLGRLRFVGFTPPHLPAKGGGENLLTAA